MPLDSALAITIAGIEAYDEELVESFGRNGCTATRTLLCRWADRIALISALLGGATVDGPVLTLNAPMLYPDAAGLRVDQVDPEGEGIRLIGPNGMIGYEYARLRVNYKSRDENDPGGGGGDAAEVGSLSLDYSGEMLVAPKNEPTFKWKSDNEDVPVEATPGIGITRVDFTRALRNLPQLPVAKILSLVDHVNDADLEGASKGKVIYRGASSTRRFTLAGAENFDLAHKFQFRSKEWNKFLRPSTGGWEEIVFKSGGAPLFPEGDLASLLRP